METKNSNSQNSNSRPIDVNIVPGIWLSGDRNFFLYQYPEDAVVVYIRWLKGHLRCELFAYLANLAEETNKHKLKLARTMTTEHPDRPWMNEPIATLTYHPDNDIIIVKHILRSVLLSPIHASSSARTETGNNIYAKTLRICNEISELWKSISDLGKKHNKSLNLIDSLACGGDITYTEISKKMLVIDKTEILTIPLIKVLYSNDGEPKMGWILLLPAVQANLRIIDLNELALQENLIGK
jgi:hypothetical protein